MRVAAGSHEAEIILLRYENVLMVNSPGLTRPVACFVDEGKDWIRKVILIDITLTGSHDQSHRLQCCTSPVDRQVPVFALRDPLLLVLDGLGTDRQVVRGGAPTLTRLVPRLRV
jgi:hypothetical protein